MFLIEKSVYLTMTEGRNIGQCVYGGTMDGIGSYSLLFRHYSTLTWTLWEFAIKVFGIITF